MILLEAALTVYFFLLLLDAAVGFIAHWSERP